MILRTSLLAALTLACAAPAAAETTSLTADDHQRLAHIQAYMAQVKDAEPIWPGFNFKAIPVVLHRPGGIAFLVNHGGKLPAGYAALESYPGIAMSRGPSAFPRGISLEQPLGDRQAVTVSFLSETKADQDFPTAFHEAFHRYQFARPFYWGSTRGSRPQSARDLGLAEVEQHLLADALEADDLVDARAIARLFLAVRHDRHRTLPASSRLSERGLETIEGTAAYVEERLSMRVEQESAGIASLASALRGRISAEDFSRARYYDTGAAMAFLLDRLRPDWKAEAEAEQPMTTLLAAAVGYGEEDQAMLLDLAATLRPFEPHVAPHERTFAALQQASQAARAAFEASSGTRVVVSVPMMTSYGYGGVSVTLSDDETLMRNGTISLEQQGNKLAFRGDVLISRAGDRKEFTFFTPLAKAGLSVDGAEVPLGQDAEHRGAVRLRAEGVALSFPEATLTLEERQVRITL